MATVIIADDVATLAMKSSLSIYMLAWGLLLWRSCGQ